MFDDLPPPTGWESDASHKFCFGYAYPALLSVFMGRVGAEE